MNIWARIAGWAALIFGLLYFILPLAGLFEFSLRARRGVWSRIFPWSPGWIRLGLPGLGEWDRLTAPKR